MLKLAFLLAACLTVGCDKVSPSDEKPEPEVLELLQKKQDNRIQKYKALIQRDGWLATDCDGALWSYTAAAFAGCPATFNSRASEYAEEPGRLGRTPDKFCWEPDTGDQGSKTNWSGDMGKGLIVYGIACGDLSLLEDHADYGFQNQWIMSDGEEGYLLERAFYRPSIRGELYSAIFAQGGEDDAARLWPTTYTGGLTDFQAHLQMLSIWIRADLYSTPANGEEPSPEADANLASEISRTMYKRIQEHASRDNNDPFFQSLYAIYSGDQRRAVELCSKDFGPEEYVGEYVRCEEFEKCQLAHLLKSCGILLKEWK